MLRWMGVLALVLAASLAVGCSGAPPLDETPDAKPRAVVVAAATPEARATPETTVGAASSVAGGSAAPSPGPFAADARAEGGSGLDADTVLAVRYGEHEGYERVVLDLGAGEEPARVVPRWTIASPAGDGLLRINLPSASATGVSDGGFGEGLVKDFHVVRAPEGGLFVDVTAREAFRYRVLELADPARLVLDFEPAGAPPAKPPPAEDGLTVLVEPRSGARVSGPLTVSGYSRNFEAANTIILEGGGGKVLVHETVTGNDWSSTWGYFEATLDLPPFSGEGVLKVGAAAPRDGAFEGVEIPVSGGQ